MKRILVIDDDIDTLQLIKIFLEANNFEVFTFSNGEITITEILSHSPDVILLDVYLKGSNGVEICNQLKGDSLTRHIPIIMLSAQTTDYLILRKCAAEDFISKPINMDELIARIDKQIKASEERKKNIPPH